MTQQVVIICAVIVSCVSALPLSDIKKTKSFVGIFEVDNKPECAALKGDNFWETTRLRNECEMVYLNDYIQWSEKMMANQNFVKDLEIVDVTDQDGKEQTAIPTLKDVLLGDRPKRSILESDECPVFDDNYLSQSELLRDRSLSPWKFVVNLNRSRIPKMLIDTKCKCTGCINMNTGVEDLNMASVALQIPIPVTNLITKKMEKTNVNFGCTCVVPS